MRLSKAVEDKNSYFINITTLGYQKKCKIKMKIMKESMCLENILIFIVTIYLRKT